MQSVQQRTIVTILVAMKLPKVALVQLTNVLVMKVAMNSRLSGCAASVR